MSDAPASGEPSASGGVPPENLKTLTAVVYGLQAASFLIGLSAIVAVVINYVKKDEVTDSWLDVQLR